MRRWLHMSTGTHDNLIDKLKESQASQKPYLNASLVIVDAAGYLPTTQEAHVHEFANDQKRFYDHYVIKLFRPGRIPGMPVIATEILSPWSVLRYNIGHGYGRGWIIHEGPKQLHRNLLKILRLLFFHKRYTLLSTKESYCLNL